MKTFFLLMCAHALCDFQLQNGAMHDRKRPGRKHWYYWMAAHALISGGAVYVVTQSFFLGVMETVAHWLIDYAKAKDHLGWHSDQFLHVSFRILYAVFSKIV